MGTINFELIEKVCKAFGKTLENDSKDTINGLLKYPSLKVPESKLPYPKPVIEYALKKCIEHSNNIGDKKMADYLAKALAYLSLYVPDEEANRENYRLLKNEAYLEAIFNSEKLKKYNEGNNFS